ncbi:hypothetical protein [Ponticaulis sp.]|uniref:hypothetical protein n=1 Tax=Ponticaulis sp. TaxID=2020902 RepID=UPI002623BCA6|nr:hypothetical protein [Ponticaulis sp.]MDF1680720.1 hypothetical protein [Ponticaulis sp.]
MRHSITRDTQQAGYDYDDRDTTFERPTKPQRKSKPALSPEQEPVRLTLVGTIDFKRLAHAISDYTSWLPFEIAASHSGVTEPDKQDMVALSFRYTGPAADREHMEANLRSLFDQHFNLVTESNAPSEVKGD